VTPVGARRSGRKRKSNIIYIDGHPVKTENNYVLKGHSYSFGAFEGAATKKSRLTPTKSSQDSPKQATGSKKKISPAEFNRMEHNNTVKSRVENKQHMRRSFLARNVEILTPFIDEDIESSLRSYNCRSGEDNFKEMQLQPDLIRADLRDYQMIGLNWMVKMHRMNLGMILGDEMGLGKTLQTISLLCYLKEYENISGPSLVICPLSVLYSWCNELSKWAPDLKFLRFHSSGAEQREQQKKNFILHSSEYDVVITTYEMAKSSDLTHLWRRQHFNYVVLDEGHIIKEAKTQISQAVRKLHSENVLILTGTPLQNNLYELWSILNYLYPDILTTSSPFSEAFDIGKNAIDKEQLNNAHELLGLFMLRRLKVEVERLMPKKIETKVVCPLSNMQKHWYKSLLLKDMGTLASASEKEKNEGDSNLGQNSYKQLNNLIMQLRKCCNHPFVFDGAEGELGNTTCQDLIAASGKLAVLDKLLLSLFQKGHRVVVFSQFTTILNIIDDYCFLRGWKYCRFDGSTSRAKRNFVVRSFNDPESDSFIFLLSTRSGGMGLNLQSADTCILYDSDWNPQPDIQAMARVHRIGQTKTVHVYRLVSGGTVEERMVERAEKKLFLDQMVNRGSAADSDEEFAKLTAGELLSTLRFGCNAVFGEGSKGNFLPTKKEINIITNRNRSETFSAGNLQGGVEQTAKDFDANQELTGSMLFDGIDFRAIRNKMFSDEEESIPKSLRGISKKWTYLNNQEKRIRKDRIVLVKGNGSGYGSAFVPILASNNYDLESGESSVFQRELKGRAGSMCDLEATKKTPTKKDYQHQNFCQVCGDGRHLHRCMSCPISYHPDCIGATSLSGVRRACTHHRCCVCSKNHAACGGFLFPCQSCANSYCEDCLPSEGVRLLGRCERFEELGYDTTKYFAYIHCSSSCEMHARNKFNWRPKKNRDEKAFCPEDIDISYAFGKREHKKKNICPSANLI